MMLYCAVIMCLLPGRPLAWAESGAAAQEPSVEVAGEVLRAQRDMPWYDAENDAIRRIDVTPKGDDRHRQSDWGSEQQVRDEPAGVAAPSFFWNLMQVVAWTALGVLLVALMWLLVWAARRLDSRRLTHDKAINRATVDPQRMEELPMALPLTDQNLLAAARACMAAGDYGLAIIYAYAHQLMELDRHHAIELRKGKTNRQYLRELRARPRLRALLHEMMLAFEEVFFGHHTLSRPQFERCWAGLDEFHRQLEQLA
jgi:hypothetical protein